MLMALTGPSRPPLAGGAPRRLVILLQGLGADGNALIGLSQYWGQLMPEAEFVEHDDERMVRTVDAIRQDLEVDGLLCRYRGSDGLTGREGAFLACTFWLVECLVHQGRLEEAREVFDRAASAGNDVGLFSEEYDPKRKQMLGNFPQGLTHLSHIAAALALGAHHLPGVEASVPDGSGS